MHELRELVFISLYLYVSLGAVILMKTAELHITDATGIGVHVIAQGTGQALETARRGDADLVLVHDPEAEEKFIGEGFGIDRQQIAWNDFVIVGPKDDPAHIGTRACPSALTTRSWRTGARDATPSTSSPP
jgi:ABC-type tungstate transport system permease subunit